MTSFKICKIVFLSSCLLSFSCAQKPPRKIAPGVIQIEIKNRPILGHSASGQKILLGGFSGLQYLGKDKNEDYLFVTVTDRGPVSDQYNGNRAYLLPDFSPRLVHLKVKADFSKATIEDVIFLHTKEAPLSGLPPKPYPEDPVDVYDYFLRYDQQGIDPEAVAVDSAGNFWLADEYKSSITQVDQQGLVLRQYFPGQELPKLFNERRLNRGFEGLTIMDGHLWAFLQSPLKSGPADLRGPVLIMNLTDPTQNEIKFYPFDKPNADRLGDVTVFKENSLLALEQDDLSGENSFKKIFLVKAENKKTLLSKSLFLDLVRLKISDQYLEGLAYFDQGFLAIINDNGYGVAGRSDYMGTGIVPENQTSCYIYIIDLAAIDQK